MIILIVVIIVILVACKNTQEILDFNLSDYQLEIESFPYGENVGIVKDSNDAKNKAEEIWIKLYGESVKKEKPYQVFYDKQNDVWLIKGIQKAKVKGGVAHILIETDGKVLAVWHDK